MLLQHGRATTIRRPQSWPHLELRTQRIQRRRPGAVMRVINS